MTEIKNNHQCTNLPDGWVWAKLEDLSLNPKQDIVDGPFGSDMKASEYKEEGIPVIRLQNIGRNRFVNKNIKFISSEKAKELSRHSFSNGDIVITKLGAPLGEACIVPNELKWGIIVADVVRISVAEQFINKFFISYILNSGLVINQLIEKTKGTTRPRVNLSHIRELDLIIPPIPEQYLLVSRVEKLLERVRKAKESLEKIPQIMKIFRQAALKKAFSGELTADWRGQQQDLEPAAELLKRIREERESYYQTKAERQKQSKKPIKSENELIDTTELPELPEEWVWTNVGEIAEIIHYGYTASSTDEPTGTKMLRITDIQNNTVNWDTVPFCEIEPKEKEKYLLNDGDLVFARTGATVGKSFLIRGKIPEAVFASYLIRVLLSNHIQKDFVYDFFQSHEYWLQINKGQIGIGQPNVNSQTLSKIALPLPPLPEQQEIVRRIEALFKFADESEKKATEARKRVELMTQSILSRAFRGDLTADFREAVKNWKGLDAEARRRYLFVLPEDERERVLNGDEFPMEDANQLLRHIGKERAKMERKSSKPRLREQKQKLPLDSVVTNVN